MYRSGKRCFSRQFQLTKAGRNQRIGAFVVGQEAVCRAARLWAASKTRHPSAQSRHGRFEIEIVDGAAVLNRIVGILVERLLDPRALECRPLAARKRPWRLLVLASAGAQMQRHVAERNEGEYAREGDRFGA